MPTNFPTTLDTFPSAATLATHTLQSDPHSLLHDNLGAAIAALEAKVGVNGSAVTSSLDYLLSLRAALASPTFTGTPAAPTPPLVDNSTRLATTAYVQGQGYLTSAPPAPVSSVFGRVGAVLPALGDYVVGQVTGAAPLASPAFTGTPTAPTATLGTNTTQVATTAFVLANAPAAPVSSVFGRTGAVVLASGDVTGALGYTPGTVSSVGMTVPGVVFTTPVSGSPVIGSGTLALALNTQAANAIFGGPTTGAAATPTFRALVPADIPALPSISQGGGSVSVAVDGSIAWTPATGKNATLASGDLLLPSANRLGWGTDVFLYRDGPNTLAQRNGTNTQTIRIHYTYTDSSNGSWLEIANNGQAVIRPNNNGTGTAQGLDLTTTANNTSLRLGAGSSSVYWQINPAISGSLLTISDNAVDLGRVGANRPRNGFFAGAVCTGVKAGATVDADVSNPTDGMIRVDSTNNRAYFRVGGTWKYAALT